MKDSPKITSDLIAKVREELKEIKAKDHNIGEVSDDMKTLVTEAFGPDDYSTCGYWMRAEQYLNTKN